MPLYYRIQPAGLGIDHQSETSNGGADGLHVFESAWQVFCTDGRWASRLAAGADGPHEVVEIEAGGHDDNGDVEGVSIDPDGAVIVRRWSMADFALLAAREVFSDADALTDGAEAWRDLEREKWDTDLFEEVP